MKKIFSLLIITVMVIFAVSGDSFAAVKKQINANIKTKRVPQGTVIKLKAIDCADSDTASVGNQLNFTVTENVKSDGDIVIPQGSLVRASLEDVQAPKRMYKGGLMRVYFDHIVSSTGKQVPIKAGIYDNKNITYDGALSSNTTYKTAFLKTTENTKNIVVKPTKWAWEKGDTQALKGVPKYIFAPITAIVTAPVAGIYFVGDCIADTIKKCENISVNQG
ncbi:hypothetical protein II906_12060 [bacterium]|nr:hypothetical protein [bacterium]